MGIAIGVVILAIVVVFVYPSFAPKKSIDVANKDVLARYPTLNKVSSYDTIEGKNNADKVFVQSGSLKVGDKELSHTSE